MIPPRVPVLFPGLIATCAFACTPPGVFEEPNLIEPAPEVARTARLALSADARAHDSRTIERWLVLPANAGLDPSAVVRRYVIDPRAPAPVDRSDDGWTWRDGSAVSNAVACYATIHVERDEVRMARLEGAPLLYVNGEPFAGDPERRGFGGVPVALHAGENELLVVGPCDACSLELWTPPLRSVLGNWDVRWFSGNEFADVEYPVFNASFVPVRFLHLHYHGEWRDGWTIAPLALVLAGNWEHGDPDSVSVYAHEDPEPEPVLLAFPGESAVLTPRGVDHAICAPFGSVAQRVLERAGPTEEPLHLVYGTRGTAAETAAALSRARLDQQLLWYRVEQAPRLVSDEDYLGFLRKPSTSTISAVIYGNTDTNGACPVTRRLNARRGAVTFDGLELAGDDLTGWFTCHTFTGASVAACFDTGITATRASVLLRPLTNPMRGDTFAIYRANAAGLERVIADE